MKMRQLIIDRLTGFLADTPEEGIPADMGYETYYTDPAVLPTLSDEKLLECFEACVGFGG